MNTNTSNLQKTLESFMAIMVNIMNKEEANKQWDKFKKLIFARPIDYNKIYTQLSKIQNNANEGTAEKQQTTFTTTEQNKSNSLHKKTEFLNSTRNKDLVCEVGPKSQRHKAKMETNEANSLKSWKTYVADGLISTKQNKEIIPSLAFVKFQELFNQTTLSNTRKEILLETGSLCILKSTSVKFHFDVLTIGFFSVLIKQAYEEANNVFNIWNIYDRVSNKNFKSCKNQTLRESFTKLFNKILVKKYSNDNKKRQKYFIQAIYDDMSLLEMLAGIFRECIQQKKSESINANNKYMNISQSYKALTLFYNLKVFNCSNNQIKSEYYEAEVFSRSVVTVLKQQTHFYLVTEQQDEIQGLNKKHQTLHYDLNHIQVESQKIESLIQQQKLIVVSPSVKTKKKNLDSKSTSKVIDYSGTKVISSTQIRNKEQINRLNLLTKTKQLLFTFNANNDKINALLKGSGTEKQVKNPLITLHEVYPLSRQIKYSPRKLV